VLDSLKCINVALIVSKVFTTQRSSYNAWLFMVEPWRDGSNKGKFWRCISVGSKEVRCGIRSEKTSIVV